MLTPVKILTGTARYRCGHYEEIKGLSEKELDYLRDLALHFACIACQIKAMRESNH
jgi:hypothetical protein